jgi:predicted ferric reductase
MVLTGIVLITMSKRFLGFLREKTILGKKSLVLDEHKEIHKFTGMLVFFFSVLHSFGHLFGTLIKLTSSTNLESTKLIYK